MGPRIRRGIASIAAGACVFAAAAGARAVTVCDIQAYNAIGFSPLVGQLVTVRGQITVPPGIFQPQYSSMYVQQGDCGVNVFCYTPLGSVLALGDSVQVTGVVEEYVSPGSGAGATTEIFCDSVDRIVLLSTGHPEPQPTLLYIDEIARESSEGRFVRTYGIVLENDLNNTMYLGDNTGYVQVFRNFNDNITFAPYRSGDTLTVTGVVLQYDRTSPYFDGYELVPRYQSDIVEGGIPDTTAPVYAPKAELSVESKPFYPDVGEVFPIGYAAPDRSRTVMTVYDLQGRVVRSLVDCEYNGRSALPQFGRERIRGWDGRDDLRRLVVPGVYIVRFEITEEDGSAGVATAPAVVGAKLR
ncbi:MAG: hypothetical protein FJY74_08585 [Candidatus Eisenbacteria bacterium]|nr:hypothetical protein [Candidatus Eisenbacteria bacterium]